MKRRRALATLGSVAVSGCLRLRSGGGESTTEKRTSRALTTTSTDETTTTSTETTETETWGELRYPMGLSDDGADRFLYSTCARVLSVSSFYTEWLKYDETDSRMMWEKEYTYDSGNALGKWTRRDGGSVRMYRNKDSAYWRETIGSRYTYGRTTGKNSVDRILWGREIEAILIACTWNEPERVNDTRPAIWKVTPSGIDEDATASDYHGNGKIVSVSSGSIRVDENGVVRNLDVTYQARLRSGAKKTYTARHSIEPSEEISVGTPSWLETAEKRSPTAVATYTSNKQFIRFVVKSGNQIEADSRIQIFDADHETKHLAFLKEPLEPEVPAYIYKTGNDAPNFGRADIRRGEQPASVSPEPFDGSHTLSARRGFDAYFIPINIQ